MAAITAQNITDFVRSLIGEPEEVHWTDVELVNLISIAGYKVASEFWYMIAPTHVKTAQASLVASTAYTSLPGRAIGDADFTGSGLNDATFSGTYTHTANLVYVVKIHAEGTPDTFMWSKDGGDSWQATGVSITGSAQTLDNGVTVTFGATTGHTDSEKWESDCVSTDADKILRVEVASTGYVVRKIEPDELWQYEAYNDGAASANYFNIYYTEHLDIMTDFPNALRAYVGVEAALLARIKDDNAHAGFYKLVKEYRNMAVNYLATDSMYQPSVAWDYEMEETFTRTNPVAWMFLSGKIYWYKIREV